MECGKKLWEAIAMSYIMSILKKIESTITKEEIYEIFPSHVPNRPIFNLDEDRYLRSERDIIKAKEILSLPREDIDWAAYSNINQEACSCISFFSENFYKDIFPSLLCFSISPKCILPSGGVNILVDIFITSHLDTNNVYKDWELEFLLSFNDKQSRAVALILAGLNEKWALENYWAGYLP